MARNYNPKPPRGAYNYIPRTNAEKFGASPVDYSNKEAAKKTLKEIRRKTEKRIASLKKNPNFYSYAQYAFEQNMKSTYIGQAPDVDRMSWKQIERELSYHHDFWSSKTSTAKGSRDEILRQSERIFGTDESGRLNKVMTREEGAAFWEAYYLFYDVYKHQTAALDSNRIQRLIGEEFGTFFGREETDLLSVIAKVEEQLRIENNLGRQMTQAEQEKFNEATKNVFESNKNEWGGNPWQ